MIPPHSFTQDRMMPSLKPGLSEYNTHVSWGDREGKIPKRTPAGISLSRC